MNEQEITALLDEVRCNKPQSSLDAPTLDAMKHSYTLWAKAVSLIVAVIALAMLTAATAVAVPSPRYSYVQGVLASTPHQACMVTDDIIAKI